MFRSFFPDPRPFFLTLVLWVVIAGAVWHGYVKELGDSVGFAGEAEPIIAIRRFVSGPYLWFYMYYWAVTGLFAAFWAVRAPHRWFVWSVFGTAFIIFASQFAVEVSVTINDWYGPFWDMIQAAVSQSREVTFDEYFGRIYQFAEVALFYVAVGAATTFFTSHWIFRWRQAMNEFYMANWRQLRTIEGASQRVQEDTMRFSETMQILVENFITAILTLIAFLPILAAQSELVPDLPLIGAVPYALVWAALFWSIFGTGFLALLGIKLPGLYFRNQRVEAAFRKELVYGEDYADRAQPPEVGRLFGNVRHNYFTLYFHYFYFTLGRILYLQADVVFPLIILAPSIIAGRITLGPLNQILNVFNRVSNSFQYLVTSWSTIVELLSIYKRLRAFEAAIDGEPLGAIEFANTDAKAAEPARMVT